MVAALIFWPSGTNPPTWIGSTEKQKPIFNQASTERWKYNLSEWLPFVMPFPARLPPIYAQYVDYYRSVFSWHFNGLHKTWLNFNKANIVYMQCGVWGCLGARIYLCSVRYRHIFSVEFTPGTWGKVLGYCECFVLKL